MKGRAGNEYITKDGKEIPVFMIADEILKDKKNIMSCEVVNISNKLVAHVEFYPGQFFEEKEVDDILLKALNRIKKNFSEEVIQNVYFVVRDQLLSYPLTGCGKRNIALLEKEGSDAIKIIDSKDNKKLIKKL